MYYTCPHVEYKQWLSSFPPNFVSFKWHLKNSLVIPGVPLDQHSGEKGITISGGQRARIAMARAFYANPASRTAAIAWWRPTGPWCTKWRSISKWEKTSACVIYIYIRIYIYIQIRDMYVMAFFLDTPVYWHDLMVDVRNYSNSEISFARVRVRRIFCFAAGWFWKCSLQHLVPSCFPHSKTK